MLSPIQTIGAGVPCPWHCARCGRDAGAEGATRILSNLETESGSPLSIHHCHICSPAVYALIKQIRNSMPNDQAPPAFQRIKGGRWVDPFDPES
jgi:hypothetical protein